MTARKTRNICIHQSRDPLPEIYSSISEVFRPAYAGETETSDVEVTPALGGAEVDWIAILPVWFSGETAVVLRFQTRGLETIFTTRCNGRGPDSSLKMVGISA